jgi:hypothetical protein
MSKGYLVIAQNNSKVDYLRQAYALALSLKISQTGINKISVCVDKETIKHIQEKHRQVFDQIVAIPWGDAAENDNSWKVHNKWKYYYMSPYDETVVLDTDMIFPADVTEWWHMLSTQDVWATTHVRTFRGDIVSSDYYRKTFTANDLPNFYNAFFYFKKSDTAAELFSMTEIIFQHWQRFFYKYLPNHSPERVSGDVAFALAIKLLGIETECTRKNVTQFPTFVHMKSHVQNVKGMDDDWTKSIPTYYKSSTDFKIGNFQQTVPFHYVEDSWLTDEIINEMERKVVYGY